MRASLEIEARATIAAGAAATEDAALHVANRMRLRAINLAGHAVPGSGVPVGSSSVTVAAHDGRTVRAAFCFTLDTPEGQPAAMRQAVADAVAAALAESAARNAEVRVEIARVWTAKPEAIAAGF